MKRLLPFLFLLFGNKILISQNLVINFYYEPDNYFKDSFYFPLQNTNFFNLRNTEQIITPISKNYTHELGCSKSTFTYNIKDTMTLIIGDLIGHQIIFLPEKDTIDIIVGAEINSFPYYSKDSFLMPWKSIYYYKSRNKNIYQFNDSLDLIAGSPYFDRVSSKLLDKGYDLFFETCTSKYSKRINFLNAYYENNKLPKSVFDLIELDIKSSYITNLLNVFANGGDKNSIIQKLPKAQITALENFDYNNQRLFKISRLYPKALLIYTSLYLGENPSSLSTQYNLRKKLFKGEIRDFLISWLLKNYIKNTSNEFDSLLADFRTFSMDSNSVIYLDSARKIFHQQSNLSIAEILKTEIIKQTGQKISINKILEGKPVFIDCWASWCKPCLDEMPFTKQLEEKYKNKIQILFLSYDKNIEKWKEKSTQLNLSNSYLLPNDFDNNFSYYFNISSIPHYILLDKNLNLVSSNAPRPSSENSIIEILDDTLKK